MGGCKDAMSEFGRPGIFETVRYTQDLRASNCTFLIISCARCHWHVPWRANTTESRHISVAQLGSVRTFHGILISFVFSTSFVWDIGKTEWKRWMKSGQVSQLQTFLAWLRIAEAQQICLRCRSRSPPRQFCRIFVVSVEQFHGWDPYIAKPGGPCSMRTAIWRAWSKVFLSMGT